MTTDTVTVLFARTDSIYKRIPGCDVWDIERDARLWLGGNPVVAHPPCRAWGRLRHFSRPRPRERALALFAIRQIRLWGGVIEHPYGSRLWPRAALPAPGCFGPYADWTLPVHQHWWGHRARKATLLYICGCRPGDLPEIPMRLDEPSHTCGLYSGRDRRRCRPEIGKREREATPEAFAHWLVAVARRCHRPVAPLTSADHHRRLRLFA